MSKIIRVLPGIKAREYNSLAEASESAARSSRSVKYKCDMINGKIVVDYQFNGISLVVKFDNEMYLLVSPSENSINWNVLSSKPYTNEFGNYQDIIFEFTSGTRISWDWKVILDGFVGKQVAISPSDQFLFIFSPGGPEYIFDFLVDMENTNIKYLFLSES
jgi:hypothetical protein